MAAHSDRCILSRSFAPLAVAEDLPAEATRRLQDLIIKQQRMIERLEENQAGQAREIDDLKRQMNAGGAAQPSSEGQMIDELNMDFTAGTVITLMMPGRTAAG